MRLGCCDFDTSDKSGHRHDTAAVRSVMAHAPTRLHAMSDLEPSFPFDVSDQLNTATAGECRTSDSLQSFWLRVQAATHRPHLDEMYTGASDKPQSRSWQTCTDSAHEFQSASPSVSRPRSSVEEVRILYISLDVMRSSPVRFYRVQILFAAGTERNTVQRSVQTLQQDLSATRTCSLDVAVLTNSCECSSECTSQPLKLF